MLNFNYKKICGWSKTNSSKCYNVELSELEKINEVFYMLKKKINKFALEVENNFNLFINFNAN
jgi:hypothetical protein